jgi:hypothetical protein
MCVRIAEEAASGYLKIMLQHSNGKSELKHGTPPSEFFRNVHCCLSINYGLITR